MSRRGLDLVDEVSEEHKEVTGCEGIPEWAPHPDLDPMLGDWIRIAGMAWQGFILEGAGALVVRICTCGIHYDFRSKAIPACALESVQGYDPEEEVVVVVQRGDDQHAYLVAGWPSPPQAFAVLPAEATGATVH